MGYAGSEWIKRNVAKDIEMSDLGIAVADLLGDCFLGIYHLNYTSLGKVEWDNQRWIEVTVRHIMATVDGDELTRLVVLSHDRLLRVEMRGIGPGYIRLSFNQRDTRKGTLMERVPMLEDHVKKLREHFGDPIA